MTIDALGADALTCPASPSSCRCSTKAKASPPRSMRLPPLRARGVEVIVVDGGSSDATAELRGRAPTA